jgi:hypothetical protein
MKKAHLDDVHIGKDFETVMKAWTIFYFLMSKMCPSLFDI